MLLIFLLPSSGVDLMFDTKLPEMGDLTLVVILLLRQILVIHCEIRFLIRLGRFYRRFGMDAANTFLNELLLDTTNERPDETDGIPVI